MLTRSLITAALATSLFACLPQHEAPSDLQRAIPTADQVQIKLPGGATRQLGQLAEWYGATRNVTRTFNGGTAWVFVIVHTIIQFPVTTVDGNKYTWGPWSAALDPAEYKLDVLEVGDGTYEYQLSGRTKLERGSAFEIVLDGFADPRAGADRGHGSFVLDFDAGRRVNPIDAEDARGKVTVAYDLAAKQLELAIDSVDDRGEPVLAEYAYTAAADGGGDMTFSVEGNAGGTAAIEQITLRSRWLGTGEGRADARVRGGDLGDTGATASECWDDTFRRVYYADSVNLAPAEGTVDACAFATQDLPPVP